MEQFSRDRILLCCFPNKENEAGIPPFKVQEERNIYNSLLGSSGLLAGGYATIKFNIAHG